MEPFSMEKIEGILNVLKNNLLVEGIAIITREGREIYSTISSDGSSEEFCILSATLLGASEVACTTLNKGLLKSIVIETAGIKLILMGAGEKAFIAVLCRGDAKDIQPYIQSIASQIGEVIS